MFATKHILYDLFEASKVTRPKFGAGNPEELKYPYKVPAVRFTESFIFRKPVTFLVGENGAGKSSQPPFPDDEDGKIAIPIRIYMRIGSPTADKMVYTTFQTYLQKILDRPDP